MAGRLTEKPEVRYRTNGDAVASFCVAVPRTIQGDFSNSRWTDYIDCEHAGEHAVDLAAKLAKGSVVEICGKLIQKRGENRGGYKMSRLVVDAIVVTEIEAGVSCTSK